MNKNPLKNIEFNEKMGLFAPQKFWDLSWAEIESTANGCGPAGHLDFVPDSIYGLKITVVCQIHDMMYAWGTTEWDKLVADMIMLINLILLITKKTKFNFLCALRCYRATTYFLAVHTKGETAYWAGKIRNGELKRKV